MRVAAKVPSDTAFRVYTPLAISLDTSRLEHRLVLLSHTLLPVPSQWVDRTGPLRLRNSGSTRQLVIKARKEIFVERDRI